jgi:Right handed beta helix region
MNRRRFFKATGITAAGILGRPTFGEGMVKASNLAQEEDITPSYYVAIDGNDSNSGTAASPFATIYRAIKAVRDVKHRVPGPMTVWVREGSYYLREPIMFGPEDSGTTEAPITYAAYQGERVTLSGGRKLECRWKPFKDGIVMCALPDVSMGRLDFTQLFVNGKRQIRARFPNYDHKNPLVSGTGYVNVAEDWKNVPEGTFPYDPSTFTRKRWSKPQEAEVHIFHKENYGNLQWKVESVDWKEHHIALGWGGFQINSMETIYNVPDLIGPQSRFFVDNVFEELDAPGEWYLDKQKGLLYYMPDAATDLTSALVEVPFLENVIEFRGSERNPVRGIALSGFRIAHSASTYLAHYETPARGDWTIHRGGTVFAEGAEDCTIEKCFFDAVGGNAVFINNYNRRIRVWGNKVTGAGDSAVCLVGHKDSVQGTQRPVPADNTISNNLIHDCGFFGKQIAGVFISVSEKNTVAHNLIYNMPRAGICINDGWGGGNVIEFNKIHRTVLETSDHGPFNSWGRERYWCLQQSHGPANVSHGAGNVRDDTVYVNTIRNNYFHERRGWGIDLDDGSSNYHVYNNLCVGISIKLREGDYRLVENNIFYQPANPPGFHVGYENNHDRFVRNIIVTNSKFEQPNIDINFSLGHANGALCQVIFPPAKGPILQELDYNLYFNDVAEFFVAVRPRGETVDTRYDLAAWQALGYDKHSAYANPQFVDPENEDFTVKPQSLAIQLGFRNFDVRNAGLRPDFPRQWQE